MGQKTHPKGFRLITTQKHLSNWYSKKSNYSKYLEEDYCIRTESKKYLEDILSISTIEISRSKELPVEIRISALFPRSKEMYKKVTNFLNVTQVENNEKSIIFKKYQLKKITLFLIRTATRKLIRSLQLKLNKLFIIKLNFIQNLFEDSKLIANHIQTQLEQRIPFRRIIKQVIRKVRLTKIKGIKIEISGRLNGIDIARSEWKRDGKIPLHTLKANIDYTNHEAHTIYGVMGIKIWLFIK